MAGPSPAMTDELILLHIQRGAGEDFDHARFGLRVGIDARDRGLAQVA
jgi:hypothetical protein